MKLSKTNAGLALAIVALAGASSHGMYARPDVENVPLARLVSNLEAELAANPKNADVHIRLARLFGMAYAMNSDEVPVRSGYNGKPSPEKNPEVWFGFEPNLVPYKSQPPPDAERAGASKAYLQKSLEHYGKALELNPDSLLARLGHGWSLQQTGDTAGAIEQYRRVIDVAWPKEQTTKSARLGERFYTQETAGYLIPLLDLQRDAAEISQLKDRASRFEHIPRSITPIAIPLSAKASGKSIVDVDAQVRFDADGRGLLHRWTWINRDAGWLVYDPTGRGEIMSALQWFGNVTFWLFWNNGYEALAALDDNRDGELTGAELRYLAIWHDVNGNGLSDRGEVRSLADHGVVALSCRYVDSDGLLTAAESPRGMRLRSGETRATYDVILRPSAMVSAPLPE